MKDILNISILFAAIILALIFGVFLFKYLLERKSSRDQYKSRREAAGVQDAQFQVNFIAEGFANKILYYMVKVAYTLSFISNESKVSLKFVRSNELNSKLKELSIKANMPDIFGNYAFREVQIRLIFIFSLFGALIGSVFSYFLMFVLFIAGIILGLYLPVWALKQENLERTNNLEKCLPEMLEVVALGLRSGLTFDRSLLIYTHHFNNQFANECRFAQQKWESGICLRDEALRNLANTYNSHLFSRVVENIIRSIRFGSSLVESLEEAAVESRNLFRSKQEEIVAKAPVKMMIPTGTLILPAMLMMILGPVLLELTEGF